MHQRLALARKGEAVDLLVLTATPIPRTLVLTYFGDMDVSELREKPAGRQKIDTRALPLERLGEVIDAVARALDDGRRVYWVCPLVEESESIDLAAAEERYAALQEAVRRHGRRSCTAGCAAPTRTAPWRALPQGAARILVATTVIEVGVDVPEASVMVIEHAERFGLAQLHQLRGRIGRGAERSICLLLYKAPLGETAKARLAILRETDDGFRIAEEDLRLRGEGDVLGTRQSGMPGFRLARLEVHGKLLERGARRRRADAQSRPEAQVAARRGVAPAALSVRARRSDQAAWAPADQAGLRAQPSSEHGSGPKRFGRAVPRAQYQMIRMIQPTSGMNASRIHQPLRSRSCSRRTATAMPGRKRGKTEQRGRSPAYPIT